MIRIRRLCNPHDAEVDPAVCADSLLSKIVSAVAPSTSNWVYQDRISKTAVYRVAGGFDFDPSKLMLVPDFSSEPLHYFMFLNVKPFEDKLKK